MMSQTSPRSNSFCNVHQLSALVTRFFFLKSMGGHGERSFARGNIAGILAMTVSNALGRLPVLRGDRTLSPSLVCPDNRRFTRSRARDHYSCAVGVRR